MDQASALDLVHWALELEHFGVHAVVRAEQRIAALVDKVTTTLIQGGRVVYVGSGTSGRVAAMDAAEIPGTFGVGPDRVVALIAGGVASLASGQDQVEDDVESGAHDVRQLGLSGLDLVVGITASGSTPYVLAALTEARTIGVPTAAVVNTADSPVSDLVEVCVEVVTGEELIIGSTRLKAATAQKVVLNTVSTAAFIRAGYTYGNLMICSPVTSAKLTKRVINNVVSATGVTHEEAEQALAQCDNNSARAVIMILAGLDPEQAAVELALDDGACRRTMRRLGLD